MTAPDPHADRLAAIEAAPYAEESAVERVAAAVWESMPGTVPWAKLSPRTPTRDEYRRIALAALNAMSAPVTPSADSPRPEGPR